MQLFLFSMKTQKAPKSGKDYDDEKTDAAAEETAGKIDPNIAKGTVAARNIGLQGFVHIGDKECEKQRACDMAKKVSRIDAQAQREPECNKGIFAEMSQLAHDKHGDWPKIDVCENAVDQIHDPPALGIGDDVNL